MSSREEILDIDEWETQLVEEEVETPSGGNKKRRKPLSKRADCWEHFTKFTDNKGQLKGKCNYCSREFYCDPKKNGTSSLNAHMGKCTKFPSSVENTQTQLNLSRGLDGGALSTWKFDNELARKAVALMIIMDEKSFKSVEREGFRYLMGVVQPKFHLPSRKMVAKDVLVLYRSEKSKLKSVIKGTCQRVCLTTDTWTSNQRINYMCVTTHYVDYDWKVNKKIISFAQITSHKGEAISQTLDKVCRDWGIDKLLTVTVDNASSNDVALVNLKKKVANWENCITKGEHLHLRCVAHFLNLIVNEGLKDIDDCVGKVRNAVRYVRLSPSRLNLFKECVKEEKIDCKTMLCLDVPTRWNSTYLMLDVATKYEKAFERFDEQDPMFKIDLEIKKTVEEVGEDGTKHKVMRIFDGRPTSDDWANARRFAILLHYFYDLTLKISGSQYVTSNTLLQEVSVVYFLLQEWCRSDDFEVYQMGMRMKTKFDKYWGEPKKMNKLMIITAILDPKRKLAFVQFHLRQMYGEEGLVFYNEVKNVFFSLYNDYKVKMEGQSGVSNETTPMVNQSPNLGDLSDPLKRTMQLLNEFVDECNSSSGCSIGENRSEIDKYISESNEEYVKDLHFDILNWWKRNAHRYPILAQMARDVLAIPVSTVASECAFSTGGRVLDPFRSSLSPKKVEALVCAQDWLRRSLEPVDDEEELEDLDKFDEGNIFILHITFYLVYKA